jgi:thiamine-monophosphate kinase
MNEFELIQQYFAKQPVQRAEVIEGIGDDAALMAIPPDQALVVTTDTLVGQVHFPEHTAPRDIGYKALAVNLSDLAAMGATPLGFTLALTLPAANEQWIHGFCEGLFELALREQAALIGGNLAQGPLSITIQALGLIPRGKALLRRNAKPHDRIYVTGSLGEAALALLDLQKKITLDSHMQHAVMKRFNRPEPQLQAGHLLRQFAHAAIDISDGLAADLTHLLEASHVGATVNVDHLPIAETVRQAISKEMAITLALTGGEDYELCFTVPVGQIKALEGVMRQHHCPMTCIGEITAQPGLHLHFEGGEPYHGQTTGYQHF